MTAFARPGGVRRLPPDVHPEVHGTDMAVGRLVLWGLLVWAAVTISMWLVGHLLLDPAMPLIVAGFFLSVIPLMAIVTYPIYRWLEIAHTDRGTAAALMSIPGLFLDVGVVLAADVVLPKMGPGAVINFGAILLFGYAVVLITGLYPQRPGFRGEGLLGSPSPD